MTTGSGTAGAPSSGRRLPPVSPRQVIAVLVALLVVVFVAQNRDSTSIEILSIDVNAPLWLILTVMAVLGAVVSKPMAMKTTCMSGFSRAIFSESRGE